MRSKLKLNPEQLAVDSFDTTVPGKSRGTVFGEQCTCPTACTCPGCPSCDDTCPVTCPNTCQAGCGTGSYTDCCPDETCQNTRCGNFVCCA
ncbi:MAG TPA: hypothetical protein VFR37_20130 [Longimicrobium sp.]|nr:hypothetical protein [Longimicrobium sp.]